MRQLVNVTNVDAPDADYPKGRVRDKVGATLGTEYSEILHGDVIQFFQKLIIDAAITENDLPDNVTNGYQLLEALDAEIRKQTKPSNAFVSEFSGPFNAGTHTITAETHDRMVYAFTSSGTSYQMDGFVDGNRVGQLGDNDSMSFMIPAGFAGTITHVAGTGSITIKTQKFGV